MKIERGFDDEMERLPNFSTIEPRKEDPDTQKIRELLAQSDKIVAGKKPRADNTYAPEIQEQLERIHKEIHELAKPKPAQEQ